MLRSTQRLCCHGVARPIGRLSLLENTSPSRWRATIIAQTHPKNPQPRNFTISHSFRAGPFKPLPQAQDTPSTAATPTSATETYPDNVSPPSSPESPKARRGFYYAMFFFLFGATMGSLIGELVTPRPLPARGSDLELEKQGEIQAEGEALAIVQQLSEDPAWTSWDAYSGVEAAASQPRLTSGPMAGAAGLAFQRVFHNAGTGEVVSVVYFGTGLTGFPSLVHGGAIATVLDESLGRCAILRFPSRTGVTAQLDIYYAAPTLARRFYVIRATPSVGEDDDVVGEDGVRKGDRKVWVHGSLETLTGDALVQSWGLFVVPKAYKLRPLAEGF
ncbi:hypothetical protein F5Y12DRAFT_441596 [Xylaria sp. FL1777]|nr:hypothetical protein F5Y12DRAFT_441596 [Xylaria sp. FL1777]